MDEKAYKQQWLRNYYRRYRRVHRMEINQAEQYRREKRKREADPEQLAYLAAFRESKGLNKSQFAAALGVSKSYVSNMENGIAKINHEKIRAVFPDYEGGRT